MVRKLAFVLVWLAAILPGWAQALGLGEIQLNSFLNQPLDAEIEIISSQRGETDGIKILLASPEAFERAGLEYSNVLRKLKFKLITKSNGSQAIMVTTVKGYREPFLNFLLEVNWSNGRVLREYAALVDPPSLVKATPARTTSPTSTRASSSVAQTSKAPAQPLFGAPDTPDSSFADSGGFIGDTYTTKRNDTAWKIAEQVRPDADVSVEQSMMALLRANPQAFIKQNINRLKAGYVLNIPDKDSMLSQSQTDSRAEIRQQTQAWRNRGTSVAAAPKGHLEILPPKSSSGGSQASGSSTSASGGSDDLHRDAMLAREAAEAQRQENAELRLRISELEELINSGRLEARLKSDKMAALEKKLAELNAARGQPTADAPPATDTMSPATPEPTAVEPPPAVVDDTQAAAPETPAKPKDVVPATPAAPGTPINQHTVGGFEPVDVSKLPKSGLPDQPFKTGGDAPAPAPVADKGLLDDVSSYFNNNPMTLWIVIAAAGILILLIIVMVIRGRRGNDDFEESILQEQAISEATAFEDETTIVEETELATETENFFETVDVDSAADDDAPTEVTDTSFLSDMVMSDMSDLEGGSGESDPLTEADVFLAYGRFGPAETMIKDAIAKEPERNDLRLKLLEIYYSAKNKDAFESEAMAFNEDLASNPDPDAWEKVVEMGGDLCPDQALFGSDAMPTEDMSETSQGDDEDTAIMDFDLGEFEDQLESLGVEDETEVPTGAETGGLDLDLGELTGEATELEDPTMEITAELEGIADVLSDEIEATEATEATEALETTQELDAGDGLDITQELDAGDGLDITQELDATGSAVTNEITQEIEVPDLADEMDLDDTAASSFAIDSVDLDEDALTDIDEVGTKLDLARAYIDMGDPEGAKSILNEVIEEGNDSQKGEAEGLMGQL